MKTSMHATCPAISVALLTVALVLGGCDKRDAPPTGKAGSTAEKGAAAAPAPAAAAVPQAAPSDKKGPELATELLAQWKAKNPDRAWELDPMPANTIIPPHDNRDLLAEGTQGAGHSYGNVSEKDVTAWEREVLREVQQGARIFHDADLLSSETSVSCDMCHPDAAHTHPETYPKYQVQLGRVVHLRDMINWCIQQPIRGEVLDANDPRMRALEAYIYAQRKGVPLDYGRR